MSDLRDEFEATFPIPRSCKRCGDGYAAIAYNAWECLEYIAKWEGWKASRAAIKIELPPEHEQAYGAYDGTELRYALDCAGISYE
jgi:hypothetical protein